VTEDCSQAEKSPLISEELEGQLKTLLVQIPAPVTLVCIAGPDDKSREMIVFLRHLVSLSPQLSLTALSPGEKPEQDALLDATLLPATGLWNAGGFCRMVFHGVPGGHELSSFVTAVLTAGGVGKPLDKPTLKDIAKIQKPVSLQICVSLGCQHCAKLVIAAQRVAAENAAVTAHMIDANLYPEIVSRYAIQRVPVLAAEGKMLSVGGMTMAELCALLRKRS
jgi:alkyl hydroperoxide reductase subunit AhpF